MSGRSRAAAFGTLLSGWYCPLSSAAAAVTILNVEPGGYVSRIARLSIGRPVAESSRSYALRIAGGSCEARRFGSNDGVLAIARIAPVLGLIATTAPRAPCRRNPRYAARCACGSSVSVTLPPLGGVPVRVSMTRRTNSDSSVPDRIALACASMPVAP